MGVADRKEREKVEMRRQILAAAQKLFLEQGYEKTSIRNIAEVIEYSAGTIYLYFKDKNEILFALHVDAFNALMHAMQAGIGVETDPFERLISLGKSYLKYAFENPELYDLMFVMTAPMETLECRDEIWCDGERAFNTLKLVVGDCMQAGYFAGENVETVSVMMWSLVHGLATLHLRRRTMIFPEERRIQLLEEVYDRFVEMVKTYKRK
ncbi:regulatory protein TetR [Emticicia oligotrophica DSM 17448]|uniref:Regulatory protein TetR n=1 Tax=Emticicia oligotrophica (strain DSM 17448 / CIP 109782 / MTCC 6937 / GPTSA100-15) TaxID=929562 RepID=A0ABN4AK88_EMTOG|nr:MULTISPECIES: TetR/AcrR family transcriptional regulator [Emticicia]AFK02597.1 regulatory protein TetR [Emticicia oligotrophica DSM 17448]